MAIRFSCPICKSTYKVDDRSAGKKANCRVCGQRVQVPGPHPGRTILGETLPESAPRKPAADPSWWEQPAATTASPSASGPIRFACPHCSTNFSVNRASGGKIIDCANCGESVQVPAVGQLISVSGRPPVNPPVVPPAPTPPPVQIESPAAPEFWVPPPVPVDLPVYQPPVEEEAEPDVPYVPSYLRRPSPSMGMVNRVLGGVSAGLLFIALFLPMVHGPMGFWVSFLDLPLKVVTMGFEAADHLGDAPRGEPLGSRNTRTSARDSAKSVHIAAVGVGAIVYPVFLLAWIGVAAFQAAAGRSKKVLLVAGVMCGAATLLYAVGLLSLNAIDELRLAMLAVSPGVGWAIMFIGCVLMIISGMARPRIREF